MGLFELGRIVATPGALTAMMEHPEDAAGILDRHASGDWGQVCAEDAKENDLSVREGFRILSSYPLDKDRVTVWIITEADRSATTILLPSEY